MATKTAHLPLEIAHFMNFYDFLPDFNYDEDTVFKLLSEGLLQVSSAFEAAIVEIGGKVLMSENGMDFTDKSDAKLSSVRTSGYGKVYSAPVTSIHTKIGKLRVQVYERKQDRFYYFLIPYNAYKHIPKTSNIDIPFEFDGTPKRVNGCSVNWWGFEVNTFKAMCK